MPAKKAPKPAAPSFRYKLSSGLFLLPQNSASVDWSVVNDSQKPQTFRVTVYRGVWGWPRRRLRRDRSPRRSTRTS
jgi:hypothetical protein